MTLATAKHMVRDTYAYQAWKIQYEFMEKKNALDELDKEVNRTLPSLKEKDQDKFRTWYTDFINAKRLNR